MHKDGAKHSRGKKKKNKNSHRSRRHARRKNAKSQWNIRYDEKANLRLSLLNRFCETMGVNAQQRVRVCVCWRGERGGEGDNRIDFFVFFRLN